MQQLTITQALHSLSLSLRFAGDDSDTADVDANRVRVRSGDLGVVRNISISDFSGGLSLAFRCHSPLSIAPMLTRILELGALGRPSKINAWNGMTVHSSADWLAI